MRSTLLWMSLVVVLGVTSADLARAFDVARCGDVVPRGEVGVLIADLDCSAMQGRCEGGAAAGMACDVEADCGDPGSCSRIAVGLEHEASLDLQGHTLLGPSISGGYMAVSAVHCEKFPALFQGCNRSKGTVVGPGLIRGNFYLGRGALTNMDVIEGFVQVGEKLDAQGVTITDAPWQAAIMSWHRKTDFTLKDVVISNAPDFGIHASGGLISARLNATNVTVNGCGEVGIVIDQMTGTGVTVTGCRRGGMYSRWLTLSDSRAEANLGFGIMAMRMRLRNVVSTNNAGAGIVVDGGGPTRLENVSVLSNGGYGVSDRYGWVRFFGGIVQGNASGDVATRLPPRGATTCDTSVRFANGSSISPVPIPGVDWNFCLSD